MDDSENNQLCYRCIGEDYLKAKIRAIGQPAECSYCDKTENSVSVREVSDLVQSAFERHYTRTSDQPDSFEAMMLSDKESRYEWERKGEPVIEAIMNAADIPEAAAEDIQRILSERHYDHHAAEIQEETEFEEGTHYELKEADDQEWHQQWQSFERELKQEARFFSQSAARLLCSVFKGIDSMQTHDGRPLVLEVAPGTAYSSYFRGRVFQSEDKLTSALCRPDLELSGPPSLFAPAGRMNARGISVFYGSSEPEVAVAEVRAPVGSRVAIAEFKVIRALRLLDLTALREVGSKGSVFDPEYSGRLERESFLRSLSHRITRPVMPDDEIFEYLPTQAVADFLATETTIRLDGVLFPSVQVTAGEKAWNVVLFHKSSRVARLEIPEDLKVEAWTGHSDEDGWHTDYTVFEEAHPRKIQELNESKFPLPAFPSIIRPPYLDPDPRDPTLRIIEGSVEVHHVRGVEFETEKYRVSRFRSKGGGSEF